MDRFSRPSCSQRMRGAAAEPGDRPANQGRGRRPPARGGLWREQDGGDPAPSSGEGDAKTRGSRRAERGPIAQGADAQGGRGARPQGCCAATSACPSRRRSGGMVRTYLVIRWSKLPLGRAEEQSPSTSPRRAASWSTTISAWRRSSSAHHRISAVAQAGASWQGADPVLRRPARRGQNLARPVSIAAAMPEAVYSA